jgi:integrase
MQRGTISHDGTSWHLRYQKKILNSSGKPVWKKAYARLGEWEPEHGNKLPDKLRDLADKILSPQNQEIKVEALMPVRDFFEKVWLPLRKQESERPQDGISLATYQSDCDLWKLAKPHIDLRRSLRDFSTADCYSIMEKIRAAGPRSKATFNRLKSFVTLALRHAVVRGILQYNVMRECKPPRGVDIEEKQPYTREEVNAMLAAVTDPATRTALLLLSRTGMRIAELMGLRWADLQLTPTGGILHVQRRVFYGRARKVAVHPACTGIEWLRYDVSRPKTKGSKREIKISREMLAALLALEPDPETRQKHGWIFYQRGPMNLANRVSTHIRPQLKKAGIAWRGFHVFRHTAATLIDERGADATHLLGHATDAVTKRVYTHRNRKQSAERAADELEAAFREKN